jgi:hypothetical protein
MCLPVKLSMVMDFPGSTIDRSVVLASLEQATHFKGAEMLTLSLS